MLEVGCASVADSGNTEIRRGILRNSEHWQGRNYEAVYHIGGMLACRALSRLGDGFYSFNFSFAFCGVPDLCEIDQPLIG